MRDIHVNLTDTGLQVLFDGYPSPRFERYLRNAGCAWAWVRRACRVFIMGPLWAFGMAIVFGLVDGSLHLRASATDDLDRLQLAIDVKSRQPWHAERCADVDRSSQGRRCSEDGNRTASGAGEVLLERVQFLYLVGIWFGVDSLLRERRKKQQKRRPEC